jgi:predicted nucleic acid-binding Zn ribbon protein
VIQSPKKSKKPQLLSELLPDLLDELKLSEKLMEQKAILLWNRAVGQEIKKHTKPYSIENGVLVVLVDNSAWMNELTFLKTDIIKKLNTLIFSSNIGPAAVKENKEKKPPTDITLNPIVRDIRFRLMSR